MAAAVIIVRTNSAMTTTSAGQGEKSATSSIFIIYIYSSTVVPYNFKVHIGGVLFYGIYIILL